MIKDRSRAFLAELERRLCGGMRHAMARAESILIAEYTAEQSPPPSAAGEVPHRDTGQLAQNISGDIEPSNCLHGRVGVKGYNTDVPNIKGDPVNIGGLHAYFLAEFQSRQGIDDVFIRNKRDIADAFERGAI